MSNEFKDLIGDFTEEQKANYELCMKYPIIIPSNDVEFQYEYTELDFFPVGWKIAFGERWAQEVQDAINKMPVDVQKEAYIMDIKEKWGRLCVYLNVRSDDLQEVLTKYEQLSEHICEKCGKWKPAQIHGWMSFLCNDCTRKIEENRKEMRHANSCN
jgi:hypothetical protein